ncbi:MAG: hypothetical protein QW555_02115 [Nitrososphaerota archaeon]
MSRICFDPKEYIVYQPYPGLHVVYHANRVLYSGRSKYQRIDIIENEAYGIMLLLDGNLQHTEFDCHIFNRALIRPIVKRRVGEVLVLGGGSGQTAKALLKYAWVRRVTVVEIDSLVVEACRRHIPGVKEALEDRRLRLHFDNAFHFIKRERRRFGGLILDLTESWLGGPGELDSLYRFVAERCGGVCSCYIGPASPQTGGPQRLAKHLDSAGRFLKRFRVRKVFVPSFGCEQLFLYSEGL